MKDEFFWKLLTSVAYLNLNNYKEHTRFFWRRKIISRVRILITVLLKMLVWTIKPAFKELSLTSTGLKLLYGAQSHERGYTNRRKAVPGWNEYCKNLHSAARKVYLEWHCSGCIRSGILFDRLKLTRTKFKNALAFCKMNKMEILKSQIVANFKSKDKVNFRFNMRKINGKQSS